MATARHLFNQIARDIIASDIAVFETSDLNSNVMIEMGVAPTWGTRVHPIRRHDAPPPPSDIPARCGRRMMPTARSGMTPGMIGD